MSTTRTASWMACVIASRASAIFRDGSGSPSRTACQAVSTAWTTYALAALRIASAVPTRDCTCGRSRSRAVDWVDASRSAMSTNVSMAPRAMPRAFPAVVTHSVTRKRRGLKSAPFSTGGSAMKQVRSSGTNLSSMMKSWLPVPRIPIVCQVSIICASSIGSHIARTFGVPAGVICGFSPSMMMVGQ